MTDAQMLFHLGEEVEKYVAEYHALDLRRYKLVSQKQSPSYATEIGLVWKAGVDLDERLSVFKETLTTFRESQADALHTIERNYFTCLYAFFGTTIAACATFIDLTRGEYELGKDPSALTTEQLHVLLDYHQMTSVALQKVRKVFDKYTNSLAVTMSLDELVVNSESEEDANTQIDASYFVSPGLAAKQWLGKTDEPPVAQELRGAAPRELWDVMGLKDGKQVEEPSIATHAEIAALGDKAHDILSRLAHVSNKRIDEVGSLKSIFNRREKKFKQIHILADYVSEEADKLQADIRDVMTIQLAITSKRDLDYLENLLQFVEVLVECCKRLKDTTYSQWQAYEGKQRVSLADNQLLEDGLDTAKAKLNRRYTEFYILHSAYKRDGRVILHPGLVEELRKGLSEEDMRDFGLDD